MFPMRLVPRILLFNENELQPEIRAQRTLNKNRIPSIRTYILNNPEDYVFSSLTVSIDSHVEFTPVNNDESAYNIGSLKIPMSAKFVINDGQHRRAAIEEALKQKPTLGDETISVVLFIDLGLEKSQQMFADLNRYSIRPTKSLNILYDHRDPFAKMIRELVAEVKIFVGLTEMEKSTISNRSIEIFTLSGIYHATEELLQDKKDLSIDAQKTIAIEFWNEVSKYVNEWQLVKERNISSAELRSDYICAHTVALIAIGRAGRSLLNDFMNDWKKRLSQINVINWHRSNRKQWEGRVTIGGKISNSRNNILLLTNELKMILGLTLNEEEQGAESAYNNKQ